MKKFKSYRNFNVVNHFKQDAQQLLKQRHHHRSNLVAMINKYDKLR